MSSKILVKLLEALVARLPTWHEMIEPITDEIKRLEAGIIGEEFIRKILDGQQYMLVPDVILDQQQIDLIVLSERSCVVLEVKNIRGKIHLTDSPRQMIREQGDGTINIFTSPVAQLENNLRAMRHFLNKHNWPLPLYGAICFPFNTATFSPFNSDYPVLVGKDILNFLARAQKGEPKIVAKQLKVLARQIRHASVGYARDPLCVRYKIDFPDLKGGCRCSACGFVGMTRKYAEWVCVRCGAYSRNAHVAALFEYAHFVSDTITVTEAMKFLGVESRHIARRLLLDAKAKQMGSTNKSIYKLKKEWQKGS